MTDEPLPALQDSRSAGPVREAELERALEKIGTWAKAYPIAVFPEPDLKRAHEVLSAAGISLDAISASNMRHVITRVQEIVERALRGPGEKSPGSVREAFAELDATVNEMLEDRLARHIKSEHLAGWIDALEHVLGIIRLRALRGPGGGE